MSASNKKTTTPVADTIISETIALENNGNQDNSNRNNRNNMQKSRNRNNCTKNNYAYFNGETAALNRHMFQLHLEEKNKSHFYNIIEAL